jgi:hypothetical protein
MDPIALQCEYVCYVIPYNVRENQEEMLVKYERRNMNDELLDMFCIVYATGWKCDHVCDIF